MSVRHLTSDLTRVTDVQRHHPLTTSTTAAKMLPDQSSSSMPDASDLLDASQDTLGPTSRSSQPSGQIGTEERVQTHDDENAITKDTISRTFEIPPFKADDGTEVPAQLPVMRQFPPALDALMLGDFRSRHRERFDRFPMLPDFNLPFCVQIMEHVKDWALWATEITDDKTRERVLDRVFDVLTKAWFEALRLGYTHGKRDEGVTPQTSTGRAAIREELPPGLRGISRRKRETDPLKIPVFTSMSHKNGPKWAITAGELKAENISEGRVRKRAADEDSLELGDELLSKIIQEYDGHITPKDWFNVEERTELNPMGRELQLYCLYEVIMSRTSIDQLWDLHQKFKTIKQKENTKKRIDEEQERQDLFMGLALELNEDRSSSPSPSVSVASGTREGSVAILPTNENDSATIQLNQLQALIEIIEIILKETDIRYMLSTLELFDISPDVGTTDALVDAVPSTFDRCQRILNEMMFYARQWPMLSDHAQMALDLDADVDLCACIMDLELQISEKKESLKSFVGPLIAERDAAQDAVDKAGAPVEAEDTLFDTTPPPDTDMSATGTPDSAIHAEAAKRPLNVEDDDASASPLPPLKKRKTTHQDFEGRQERPSGDTNGTASSHRASSVVLKPGHSLRVTLRVKPGFDPRGLTSEKLFYHPEGFTYRYTRESTLAQRQSMKEVLEEYVQNSTEQREGFNDAWRFGTYQALAHHTDPVRETIIHGIWNLEDGTQPKGFKWFYEGNGTYLSEQQERLLSDTEAEEEDEPTPPPPPKKPVLNPRKKEAIRWRRQQSRLTDTNATTKASSSFGRKHSNTGGTKNKNDGDKSKGRTLRFKFKTPIAPQTSPNYTISRKRPKRQSAAEKNYLDEWQADDDDYVPSD